MSQEELEIPDNIRMREHGPSPSADATQSDSFGPYKGILYGTERCCVGSPVADATGYVEPSLQILQSYQTPLICSDCQATPDNGISTFYLKRRAGLYALLCFQGGQGCWEKSSRRMCEFTTPNAMQCQAEAEFEIRDALGGIHGRVCAQHISAKAPVNVAEFRVYPVDY